MNKRFYINVLAVVFLLSAVCFGFETNKNQFDNTKITKENLKQRLGKMKVKVTKKSERVNPLLLQIKIVSQNGSKKFNLNNEVYELDGLLAKLQEIYKYRQENGIVVENSNEVDLTITLAIKNSDILYFSKNKVTVENFEGLVEALQKKGFNQINLEF